MKNGSKVLYPKCSSCGAPIRFSDVSKNIDESRKILLITGTAGAGKTALGQLIQRKHHRIFVDGDAIQKRVHFYAKQDPSIGVDCQAETRNTALILLALGYDVVVGYIINKETLQAYQSELAKYHIVPVFRVLVPERSVCLQRDIARDCWTAGEVWVDQWYEEMRAFLVTDNSLCVDSSSETLQETYEKHFADLL